MTLRSRPAGRAPPTPCWSPRWSTTSMSCWRISGSRGAGRARRGWRRGSLPMPAFLRRHGVAILVLLAMAGIWQILSMVFTAEAVPGEPMVPGWQVVVTRTFLSLADYWEGGLGVPSVGEGAPPSYLAALLAILSHSLD